MLGLSAEKLIRKVILFISFSLPFAVRSGLWARLSSVVGQLDAVLWLGSWCNSSWHHFRQIWPPKSLIPLSVSCSGYSFFHGVCTSLLDRRRVSICHRVFRGWLLHHNVRFGDWTGRAWKESAGRDPCLDLLHSGPHSTCHEGLFHTKLAHPSDCVVCALHFYCRFLEVSMITWTGLFERRLTLTQD